MAEFTLDKFGISKDRKMELIYWCRQYREWKARLESYDALIKAGSVDEVYKHDLSFSDKVGSAAISRTPFINNIDIFDACLDEACNHDDETKRLMFDGIIHGLSYDKMEARRGTLPISRSNYYSIYKYFLVLVHLTLRSNEH